MKTEPVTAAQIDFDHPDHPGLPWAREFADIYHPRLGAQAQARHVFLAGNQLPARWQGRGPFVILETGFGLGNNFLATWQAWRQDPQRCSQLHYLAVEQHPPCLADLRRAHANAELPDLPELFELTTALAEAWPAPTPDLHTLSFEGGQVQLLLAFGDAARWLPELQARVDAFYLDGFAPSRNAGMWDPRLFKSCARLAAPQATLASWTAARSVRDGLAAAGFEVRTVPGFGTKRDMICGQLRASLKPSQAREPGLAVRQDASLPAGRRAAQLRRTALVIGAGLAGAAAARALARQGVAVTVLDRQPEPAAETSGNPAGLFHGVVHPQDGAHAQLLRAAALRATQILRPMLAKGQLEGEMAGLLRGERDDHAEGSPAPETLQAMQALLRQQALPEAWVSALTQAQAERLAGMPLAGPCWYYNDGGWLNPPGLVKAWLAEPSIRVLCGQTVARLQSPGPGSGAPWQALDSQGQVLAEADLAVVAGAAAGLELLAPYSDCADWGLSLSRGQVTCVSSAQVEQLGLPRPQRPVASGGYLLSLPEALGGGLLCGASAQPGALDPALRLHDQRSNLAQIEALSGRPWPVPESALPGLGGRVGWRLSAGDRLPLVGPVPQPMAAWRGLARSEQARYVPRVEGLYVLTALGSRGITLAPLLGEVLAAWICGLPLPLAGSLLDAVDAARFAARAVRQGR
jgi:tRNA 5-methylaminomethyl-2-thiouridine biosynthesis bifunctional protein